MSSASRPYRSPLREQQAEHTRRVILLAVAELVADEGQADFSMGDVAERAGVAPATLYRHFPNRQALMDGITRLATDEMRSSGLLNPMPKSPGEMPQYVLDNARAFEHVEPLSSASAIIAFTTGLRSKGTRRRTTQLRRVLDERLQHLPADDADAAFALLRHLSSHLLWMVLHDETGAHDGAAGRTAAWALRVLLDDLGRGGGPHTEGP